MVPGVFKTDIFDLAASPDLGLICTSVSSGIAIERPVGTKTLWFGLIVKVLSIKAIKSIPEEPEVLYDGSFAFGLSFFIKTLTI